MLDWLQQKIGQRSSHPMNSPAEAAKLLHELPLDEPLKAVEEVSAWLESLASATSFSTDSRLKVISMVDEAGQPCAELLMTEYLADEAKRAAGRFRQWQALVDFWERLADAYQLIVLQVEVSKRSDLTEQVGLVTVRAMRAVFHQMRLGLMRYAGQPESQWSALYHLYQFAHAQRRAAVPVRPYPWDGLSTTPRLELARAVMLEAAAPQSLPPRQIDLTARISARLSSSFAYGEAPGERLPLYLDLANANAPQAAPKNLPATPTMRFFGPGTAAVRLKEMLYSVRAPQAAPGQRFGEEFTAAEKVETLQRLLLYWSDNPPRRQYNRTRLTNSVDVAFGLAGIRQRIGKLDEAVFQEEAGALNIEFGADEEDKAAPEAVTVETWKLKDISLRGLGAVTTRRAHGALKIGALMAFRLEGTEKWCVGIVRRLQSDAQKNSHVGAEILSQDPQLLALTKLGFKQDEAWNWEVRDQKNLKHLAQAVLLRAGGTAGEESLLFEPGGYYAEEIFGTMIDNRPRKLQLGELLEKGDGFDRLAFNWLAFEPTPTLPPKRQGGGFSDQEQS